MNGRRLIVGAAACSITSSIAGAVPKSQNESNAIVPPEEGRHERTFMQWSVDRKVHSERTFLKYLQQTIADIANTIAEFEMVTLLAAKEDHKQARKMISNAVEMWDIPTDELWCRDSGPLFAMKSNSELVISHLKFIGWGEKQVHSRDGQIAERIANSESTGFAAHFQWLNRRGWRSGA